MAVRRAMFNRIGGLVLLALPLAYGFGFWRSLHDVDGFCADVSHLSDTHTVADVASRWSVSYHEIGDDRDVSKRIGFAASSYTLGDYACRVDSTSTGKLLSARILKH